MNVLRKGDDVRKRGYTLLAMEKASDLYKHERAWVRHVMRVQHLFAALVFAFGIAIIISPNISNHPVAYGVIAGFFLASACYLLTTSEPTEFVESSLRSLYGYDEDEEEDGDELREEVCHGCDKYVPYGIYIVSRCSEFHVFAEDEDGDLSSVFQSRNKQRCMEFADALLM